MILPKAGETWRWSSAEGEEIYYIVEITRIEKDSSLSIYLKGDVLYTEIIHDKKGISSWWSDFDPKCNKRELTSKEILTHIL